MWLELATAAVCALPQAPARGQLVADLAALRHGEPGQAAFDAAAPSLGAMLESGDDALIPGAAYVIGAHGFDGYANLLLATLQREAQREASAPLRSFTHVLDALVRLEVEVPAELVLARTRAENAGLAYVALASRADAARALDGLAGLVCLGLRDEPAHWAALIELTLARDPRGVDELLFGQSWVLEVEVQERGGYGASRTFNSGFACSLSRWPPAVNYRVVLPPAGAQLDSIEFTRVEVARGCRSTSTNSLDQQGWRLRLLRELLAESAVPTASDFDARIEFEHAEQVRRDVEAHVATVRARLESIVDTLATDKLVDPAAKSRLRLHVKLRDHRTAGAPPLPQLRSRADVTFELR